MARDLATSLGLDYFDREIITRIAADANLSELVVGSLDERDRSFLTDWLTGLSSERHLSPNGHLDHLTRVVGAIARHGGAVILGRGAHLILGPRQSLRVLVVAPFEDRLATLGSREGLDERAARRRISELDRDRRAFMRRYFKAEADDPTTFDLVVNTSSLGVLGAVASARAAVLERMPAVA